MQQTFTLDTFSKHLDEAFALHLDDSDSLELKLIEAKEVGGGPTIGDPPPDARKPFSLLFRGPMEPILQQRIHHFEHPVLGACDMFIVPVGQDGNGTLYEAIFT